MTTRCQAMSFHKLLCSNILEGQFKFTIFVFRMVTSYSKMFCLNTHPKWNIHSASPNGYRKQPIYESQYVAYQQIASPV